MPGEISVKQVLLDLIRHKTPLLVLIALLFFLNLAATLVMVIYQAPRMKRQTNTLAKLRGELSVTERKEPAANIRNSRNDLAKLREMIPLKQQFPAILEEIMAAASSCKVTLGAITYKQNAIKERKLRTFEITLTVTGQYGAVKSFLVDLQTLEGLAVVENISFSNKDPYIEDVTMDAQLMVYLRDET